MNGLPIIELDETLRLRKAELERVRAMSDEALRYIAPMMCGSAERAELIRRRLEREAKDAAR